MNFFFCDNKITIDISHNLVYHDKTKHIEVDRHFKKEKIEEGTLCMTYVPMSEQVADIFTKWQGRSIFEKLMGKMGMLKIFALAWGVWIKIEFGFFFDLCLCNKSRYFMMFWKLGRSEFSVYVKFEVNLLPRF